MNVNTKIGNFKFIHQHRSYILKTNFKANEDYIGDYNKRNSRMNFFLSNGSVEKLKKKILIKLKFVELRTILINVSLVDYLEFYCLVFTIISLI